MPAAQVLLLWPRNCIARYRLEFNPPVCDVRFVIGLLQDYWKDWEAGAKGFPDCWAEGDTFVACERNGLTERTAFFYHLLTRGLQLNASNTLLVDRRLMLNAQYLVCNI